MRPFRNVSTFLTLSLFLLFASCNSSKPQFVVGDNFSVWLPEAPVKTTSTNDEGLPQTKWEEKHTGLTTAEYYIVSLSCYHEVLNPKDELTSNDALLLANGIKAVENRPFDIVAKQTGRSVPALFASTREYATGILINNVYVVDGHCLISVGARRNSDNVGTVAQVIGSVTVFK
jgi:hypothetical protein